METPPFAREIHWTEPVGFEMLRVDRVRLPRGPGLYLFTNHPGAVEPGRGVLYLGKASNLYTRVSSYLKDPGELMIFSQSRPGRISSNLRHAGKVMLLVEIQQKQRAGVAQAGVWIRWYECAAPRALEKPLIGHLQPAYNTQDRKKLRPRGQARQKRGGLHLGLSGQSGSFCRAAANCGKAGVWRIVGGNNTRPDPAATCVCVHATPSIRPPSLLLQSRRDLYSSP